MPIEDGNEANLFYGLQVGIGNLRMSHLFYVDDVISLVSRVLLISLALFEFFTFFT